MSNVESELIVEILGSRCHRVNQPQVFPEGHDVGILRPQGNVPLADRPVMNWFLILCDIFHILVHCDSDFILWKDRTLHLLSCSVYYDYCY